MNRHIGSLLCARLWVSKPQSGPVPALQRLVTGEGTCMYAQFLLGLFLFLFLFIYFSADRTVYCVRWRCGRGGCDGQAQSPLQRIFLDFECSSMQI